MTKLVKFLKNEEGAVTIDWVALTAGLLLLGIMVVYAIFNGGVTDLVGAVNSELGDALIGVDTGAAPSINN